MERILPETVELASGPNFAAVSTLLPSGLIQTQMIWVGVDGGQLVLNTETHRAAYLNVERDDRITVCIRDESDPYRYAEVRERVTGTVTGDHARDHVDQLAQKYFGTPYPPENIDHTGARPQGTLAMEVHRAAQPRVSVRGGLLDAMTIEQFRGGLRGPLEEARCHWNSISPRSATWAVSGSRRSTNWPRT